MLKQKELTLNPSATSQSGFIENVKQLLNKKNNMTSELTGVSVTNIVAAAFFFGCTLLALSFLLFTDQVALYGWSAFCFLAGVNFVFPLVKKILEGADYE